MKIKNKQYDNALVKVFDFPALYFPKFSQLQQRQSGFLVPHINNQIFRDRLYKYHIFSSNN